MLIDVLISRSSSLSPGGGAPVTLAQQVLSVSNVSTMVRTTGDFWDRWSGPDGLLTHYNQSAALAYAGLSSGVAGTPFLDLDMLPLGRIGQPIVGNDPLVGRPRQSNFTHPEALAVMSLWIIARSPLIFGGSLTETTPSTLALLQAADALRVQEEAINSRQLWQNEATVVWLAESKLSSAGPNHTAFVGAFNLRSQNSTISLSLSALSLKTCVGMAWIVSVWGELGASRLYSHQQQTIRPLVPHVRDEGTARSLSAWAEFSLELQPRGGDLLRVTCVADPV